VRLRAAALCCIALLGCASAAAQLPPSPAASAASAPVYVDRVIDGNQAASPADEPVAYDSSGRPRWWRIESRLGRETASFGGSLATTGLWLQGGIDTLNHGAWSIDLQTRRARRSEVLVAPFDDTTDTVFTLRQRGFPLGGGWTMNNDLGAIGLAGAPLSRAASRVSLPSVRVQGVSGEWIQTRQGFLASLSGGRPAVIDGLFTNDITVQPGRLTQAAVQWSGSAGSAEVAAQVARGERLRWNTQDAELDARSLWLGARGRIGEVQTLAQLVTSSTQASNAAQRSAQGFWIDTAWRDSLLAHNAGAYQLGEGLNWAGVPMAGDVSGLFWRGVWQDRRWLVDGGFDLLQSGGADSTGEQSSRGFYFTGNVRHRWQRDLGWSASAALRRTQSLAFNLSGELQWTNRLGQTLSRLEVDGDRGDDSEAPASRGLRLVAQHDATLDNGATWSNGLTVGQVSGSGEAAARRVMALASSVDAPLSSALSLRGNANLERFAGEVKTGVQAALDWQLAPSWHLETRVNIDRGRLQRVRSLDPLTPPPLPPASELSARSVFVVLRYSGSAGTASAPLGGRAQDGGGTVRGVVYLDANRNGRQDAGERGASGVTVQLDARYTVVTDEQGRFEFAWVAPGSRAVTVLSETLPLPWSAPDEGRTSVQVRLRGTHAVAIGVVSN
jgi:hypothetical protein